MTRRNLQAQNGVRLAQLFDAITGSVIALEDRASSETLEVSLSVSRGLVVESTVSGRPVRMTPETECLTLRKQ
jgi:hypothetical protein